MALFTIFVNASLAVDRPSALSRSRCTSASTSCQTASSCSSATPGCGPIGSYPAGERSDGTTPESVGWRKCDGEIPSSCAMSDTIADAVHEDPVDEVLVSTSIRLTKTVMDRVRLHAAQAGVPATTLMRQWSVDRLTGSPDQAVVTVADLEDFIASRACPVDR